MNARARTCRRCGGLNGGGERRCYRCGTQLSGLGPTLDGVFDRPDFATRTLIALCTMSFVLLVLFNGFVPLALVGPDPSFDSLLRTGALMSLPLRSGWTDLGWREPWRLLSAVYGHMGLIHLGMNMLALWQLGRAIERGLGSARLVVLFTVTGLLGYVASELWHFGQTPPTNGASGALFGFIGYFVGVLFARKDPRARSLLFQQLAYAAALALLLPTNNAAHLGGFAAGIALGRLFHLERRPLRLEWSFRVVALLSLVAALVSVGLSLRSPYAPAARAWDELLAERGER